LFDLSLPTGPELVQDLILIVIFLGIAFPIHEFFHGWTAYQLGDGTAKMYGRLTLNPVVHFDPFGGLMLIASTLLGAGFIIGWAKPTPVGPWNLRDRRNGEVLVAIAGPASNLVMAVLGAIVFRVLGVLPVDPPQIVWQIIGSFVLFNISLAIFNMIPVPPLDGSAVLLRVLPPQTAREVGPMLAQYGLMIVIVVVLVGGRYIGGAIGAVTDLLLGI
jgi:Zn-dependent protease